MRASSTDADARTVHMIAGPTGAGKTTHALALCDRIDALHYGIDDWMQRLFWPDLPEKSDIDWALERVARCTAQMQAVIVQAAERCVPAVVDAGFTTRDERGRFAGWAVSEGLVPKLWLVDAATELRWARVEARNAERGESFAFAVTREMFDGVEAMWEPPLPEEMARLNGERVETDCGPARWPTA